MESILNALVSGFVSGSLYAIMALGLTIIYGISRVFNFGHGIVAVLGGYLAWTFFTRASLPFVVSLLFMLPVMYLLGWLVYRYAIRGLMKKPNADFSTVLFMLGLGIMLENIILQIFGPRVKAVPELVTGSIMLGAIKIKNHELALMVIVLLGIIVLTQFFKRTRMGQAMRAVAQSIPGAGVVGINIERIFGYTFGLAFMVTGFSGALLASKYFMIPHIGWDWMVKGFVIVAFGGMGSIPGAVVGALVLGMAESFTTLALGAVWVWPVWFIMFLVLLLLRPQGLVGGRN
ncbi:MAG: branched-chain amino acid ABC transporter permease [Spirochaetales bacterium]|nr:branched-chain amino acid ABC transporter permease [Spirochaetales bacterium]